MNMLIDGVSKAWKLFSVQVAVFAMVWAMVPPEQQKAVLGLIGLGPERATAVMGVLFILARLIKQPDVLGK